MTQQNKKYLFYAIGGVAAYFLVIKPILVKLGLQKSQVQAQSEEDIKKYLDSQIKGGKATKSAGEWAIIADQIYNDLRYSGISDNKSDAAYQVSRVKNGADLALLIKSFGKRQEYFFGLPAGSEQDLQQFITGNLSSSQLAAVNDNYRRKGIKYQF